MMLQARLCHGVISRPLRALAWMAAFRLPSVLPRRLSWTPCSRELWNRSGRDESCGVRGMKSSVAVMRDRVDSPDDAGKSPVHEDCPEQDAAEAPGAKDDPSQEKSGVEAKGPSDAVNGTEADLLEANEWYELGMNEIKLGKYSEAFEWIRKAAEVGNADAQFAMGVFYEEARGNVEKDDRKAAAWYTKAAEKGHAKAQCNLGLLYSAGIDGGEPDDVTAVRLFRESAMQGHVAAQCNLSSFYFTGRGGNEGKSYLAIDWLRTAANEGLPAAQYNLGLCYERGQGVESDVREAFEWFHKAAVRGDVDAQLRVGVYYGTGKGGLKVDMYLAKEWFREAAAQGSEMAERYFHELENHAIDPENPNREARTNILKLRRLLRKRERRSEG